MTYARERDEKKCHFHAYVENSKTLNVDGRSEFFIKRVNAPVPDCIVMTQLTLAHFTISGHLYEWKMEILPKTIH